MGFKEGFGALMIMAVSVFPIMGIVDAISPVTASTMIDNAVIIFTMLSWVMTAFTGKPVASPYGAVLAASELKKNQQAMKEISAMSDYAKSKLALAKK